MLRPEQDVLLDPNPSPQGSGNYGETERVGKPEGIDGSEEPASTRHNRADMHMNSQRP